MRRGRVLRAVGASLRVALMTALQYRASFLGEAAVAVFWLAWTIAPLFVLFQFDTSFSGWSRTEAIIVVGFFTTLTGLLDAFIDPNLSAVVEHIRLGTFDFLLLKPIDTQLLVSVHRTAPAKLPHVFIGLAVAAYGAASLEAPPDLVSIGAAALLLFSGAAILHSLWTLVVSLSFKLVRVDNLSFLLRAVIDAGRWPLAFYPVGVRVVLTFIVPVGLMTTYPALALRGLLDVEALVTALAVAAAFTTAARWQWRRAIRHYASASS